MRRHRILHCLRAPVGGLFRHVRDLAREQARRGHQVGIVCDASASDALTEARLAELAPHLALGIERVAMPRELGLGDITAARRTRVVAGALRAGILHGHGAKGGAYARLAAPPLARRGLEIAAFYTPHGGSLHFDPRTLKGALFMRSERALARSTAGIIFESAYARAAYVAKAGAPGCPVRVIHNGIEADELVPVDAPPDAADFVFVGELRHLKGVDVLLEAMALVGRESDARLVIVGAGPDGATFERHAEALGLQSRVVFAGAMPARAAFALGRALVLPSRAESLPYVALEAAGAHLPLVATEVGGLPEIVAGSDTALVPAGDAAALARAMLGVLDDPRAAAARAGRLARLIAERFSTDAMTEGVLAFYDEARRHAGRTGDPALAAA